MRFAGCRDADLGQQIDGAFARGGLRKVAMRLDGLDDLVADPIERIEAGERILKDHADPLAPDTAHLLGRQMVDPQARQKNLAARDAARRIDQADRSQGP